MRILIVTDYAYPTGGAETMVRRMREGLRARGHDARIFASGVAAEGRDNFADYRCLGTTSRFRTVLQTANPWASAAMARTLSEFDPDIVHVRMFLTQLSPLILGRLKGRRALYHLAWYRAICPTGRKALPDHSRCEVDWGLACLTNGCTPLRDWPLMMAQLHMTRAGLGRFQAVVSNSEFVRGVMARGGVESEVIHNAVPVPPLMEASPGAGRAPAPTVLFAGRLVREKGCHVAIEAFAELARVRPEAQLTIAGDGPLAGDLAAQAGALGIGANVRFTGHLDEAALATETRKAWVQVVPSIWDEPFGIVALDGMAQGRAVIASAAGGLSEIVVDGETGYLTPPGDASALARRLIELAGDPSLCAAMGARGRERLVQAFNLEGYLDRFEALYGRLLSEPCPG